jgi:Ca2+-binding EF-hand superfamily protein
MKTPTLSVTLFFLAVNARAQQTPSVEDAFTILDANRDGEVSIQETQVDDAIAARFAEADADNSGFLDSDEFAATFAAQIEPPTESQKSPVH